VKDAAATIEDARLLVARGRLEEARPLVDELIARDPTLAPAWLLKGGMLLEERREQEALAAFEAAAAAAPRSAEALNGLARCLHSLGRDLEAVSVASRARELLGEGDNFRQAAPVYLTLVWVFRELRRYREALEMAEEGLARAPDAILAQWATTVEEELALAEREEC
jgi:tetratricopeptide (TPR) repeat protein